MSGNDDFALVRRPPTAVEKTEPGAKRILLDMVADILAAADAEDVERTFSRGMRYYRGDGVPRDHAEAAKWFRKAAERGHAKAQCFFGHCCSTIFRDMAEAEKWYRKAAEQGDAEAQFIIGLGYKLGSDESRNPNEAFKWYWKAANQGYAAAQDEVGNCYREGRGVRQDAAEAIKWYRKAIEQNHEFAQVSLGECYENGFGVQRDYAEAVMWYRKAAEQGFSVAQFLLGGIYSLGQVMPERVKKMYQSFGEGLLDYCEAYKFYKMHSIGDYLSALAAKMTPEEIQEGERRYREFLSQKSSN